MVQVQTSSNPNEDEAPAWAPLRDNYMLANPKLKDWDKKQVFSFLSKDLEPPSCRLIYTLCLNLEIEFLQETSEGDDFAAMSGDESYED